MKDALLVMTNNSFGVVGVINVDGRLAGLITDGDLRRHMDDALMAKTTDEVMNRTPRTIRPEALAAEALGQMNARKITCLFVTDGDNRPVGLIHIHDCLRAAVA
ncbi:MAG: CBS domain-containing protein, partial [Asticcacaulis sp.]